MSDAWTLFDYGQVICLPQSASAVAALAGLAGLDSRTFSERYYRHRLAFDLGQPSHEYWSAVLERRLEPGDPLIGRLDALDVESWSRLDQATLRLIGNTSGRLGLLSNAPEPMAAAIDKAPWAAPFEHLFFSCRLGLAKPYPAIFKEVLRRLDTAPADVTFIDDRPENVAAAAALGINAVLHTSPG